jgi:hypothetical protein
MINTWPEIENEFEKCFLLITGHNEIVQTQWEWKNASV